MWMDAWILLLYKSDRRLTKSYKSIRNPTKIFTSVVIKKKTKLALNANQQFSMNRLLGANERTSMHYR